MANSVDSDQTAPSWSGSTLFAQDYLSENLGSLWHAMEDYQNWFNRQIHAQNTLGCKFPTAAMDENILFILVNHMQQKQ